MGSDNETLVDGQLPRASTDTDTEPNAVSDREAKRHARHELRTPLNQIIGYSELLIEDAEAEGKEQLVADLRRIEAAGRRMVTLVDRYFADRPSSGAALLPSRRPLSLPTTSGTLAETGPRLVQGVNAATVPESVGKVLIVDDDESNRQMLARRLLQAGYDTDTAHSGATALSRLEQEPFDLVLLDVLMPEMSGIEVLQRIRRHYDAGDLPVVITTALDGSDDVVEALRCGANDYVTKPLDLQVVLARIATQLHLKQARNKVRELNQRLANAEQRIAALADSAPETHEDAATWARSIAREVASALGEAEVAIWLFQGSDLVDLSDGGAPMPSADELRSLRTGQSRYRQEQALIAVRGQTDVLYGVIGVATGSGRFGEMEEHLVAHFARYLGSKLELGDMRRRLARAAAQRRAAEHELVQQGVDLLHLCPVCSRCYDHRVERCEDDGVLVHPPARPLPHKVAKRYRLLRLVGEGGMGTVFRALDERLEREVAVKLIKPEHSHNDNVRQRFEGEARLVARLDHPSVIAVFDSGEADEGSLYMVMEWLAGRDLGRVLEEQGPGSPQQVASMLRQAGSALSAAHGANLVHRDIKPDNIFISREGGELAVKVLDFGVAKEMSKESGLTRTGSLIGTPLYMSPEQVLNAEVDARSDTYSLAAVAYEALTGRRVVTGASFAEVVLSVANDDPPRLSDVLLGVCPELDEAFARGLCKDKQARPESTARWVDSFAHLLEQLTSPFEWRL